MNILYAALQRLPVAVVILAVSGGAGWHLLPILAGVGLLVGASERFILHRRLRDLDDEIADLTAADEFRRDLRNTRSVLDGAAPTIPRPLQSGVDPLSLPLEPAPAEQRPLWRDRALSSLNQIIHKLFAATQSSMACLWRYTPDLFVTPFALAFAWWDGRPRSPDVDAPLADADELGYLVAPILPLVDERETRSSAALLIAHLHAIRGEKWQPRGDSGDDEVGRHSGEALARNEIHGAPTQRRPSAAANQRLIINALWSPTQELSVIGDDDLHYFLADDWRTKAADVEIAELLNANTRQEVM